MKKALVVVTVIVLVICSLGLYSFAEDIRSTPEPSPFITRDADSIIGTVWRLKENWAEDVQPEVRVFDFDVLDTDNTVIESFNGFGVASAQGLYFLGYVIGEDPTEVSVYNPNDLSYVNYNYFYNDIRITNVNSNYLDNVLSSLNRYFVRVLDQPTFRPYSTLDPGNVDSSNFGSSQWILREDYADFIERGLYSVTFTVSDPEHVVPDHVYDHIQVYYDSTYNSLDIYYYYQNFDTDHERVARYFYGSDSYEYHRLSRCIVTIQGIGTATPAPTEESRSGELRALDPINLFTSSYRLIYLPGSGMGTVIDGAQITFFNFLVIGEGLVTFITSNWIILIPLIAWVMITGIGVVLRIIKKRG